MAAPVTSTASAYWDKSRAPRYSLLFALPLLLLYEGLAAALAGAPGTAGVRNAADVVLKTPFVFMSGTRGSLAFFATIVAIFIFFVARDLTKLPMGNSAWRLDALRAAGGFDARLAWGGEDYDVNLRVHQAGHRGAFVPDAWVYHDQSGRTTLRRLLRRKYRYNVGATMAYLKNGVLRAKMRDAARTTVAFRHPYERWNLLVQPLALVSGWWKWRRAR